MALPAPSQSLDPQVRIWLALALVSLVVIAAAFCMLLLIRWQRRIRPRRTASRRRSHDVTDPWSESARRLRVDPPEDESGARGQ